MSPRSNRDPPTPHLYINLSCLSFHWRHNNSIAVRPVAALFPFP